MDSRRMLGSLLVAGAVVALSGCASYKTAYQFNNLNLSDAPKSNVCHINGKASGLYLLTIPLITGNTEKPNFIGPVFFQDTVNLDEVARMMSAAAKEEGATDLIDLQSHRGNYWLGPAGLFVLFWRSAEMSANAVR